MEVKISKTALKIIEAISILQNKRKEDKKIYINVYSISKCANLSWRTVDYYLKNKLLIRG